jgi:general stress protein YciG
MEHKQWHSKGMATKSHRAAGLKAKRTILSSHGSDYYAKIGRKGGSKTDTRPKGFEADRALARIAGAKGGAARRKK